MQWVVTGATGALGTAMVGQLAHCPGDVRVLVDDLEDVPGWYPDLPGEVLVGSPLVEADVRRATRDCDVLVHCVEFPAVESARAADAAAVLVEAVPDDAHVVLPADALAFGDPERVPVTPATALDPRTRTARAEAEAVRRVEGSGLRTTVVFLPDRYGPGVDTPVTRRLFRQAVRGRDVLFPAPVDVPHEFVFVDDAARALVAVAGRQVAVDRRYTVGATRPVTVREFCELVYEAADTAGTVRRLPDWLLRVAGLLSAESRATADVLRPFRRDRRLDGTAIRSDVGFSPRVDPEEGVERTLAWLRERRQVRITQ